jgi:hypothetical protein
VIDLLKSYFKIQNRDDLREVREKVTGKLLTLDRALEPTLPAVLALLDVPVDEAAWQTLAPAERRQRTLDAVKRLLLREAREQPLLVIFEDLHWIDGETQALLDGLIESLGSARLLLLVNYRPEYQHAWGSKTSYSQLRLDALPAESAEELLDALLGEDPGLAPLTSRSRCSRPLPSCRTRRSGADSTTCRAPTSCRSPPLFAHFWAGRLHLLKGDWGRRARSSNTRPGRTGRETSVSAFPTRLPS